MNKMSTMFGLVLFTSLFLNFHEVRAQTVKTETKAQQIISALGSITTPFGAGITLKKCDDTSLKKDDKCVDAKGNVSVVTYSDGNQGGWTIKFRQLSHKELNEFMNISAQEDLDSLKDFCGGLADQISDRQDEIDLLNDQTKELKKAERAAFSKMAVGCRSNCIQLAITKDGTCALSPEELFTKLKQSDLKIEQVGIYLGGGQSKYFNYVNQVVALNPAGICSAILAKPDCKNGFGGCPSGLLPDWLSAENALNDARKKQLALDPKYKSYSAEECTIHSARDVNKTIWNTCDTRCLEKAFDSCPTALSDADADSKKINQNSPGPTKKDTTTNPAPVIRKSAGNADETQTHETVHVKKKDSLNFIRRQWE